MISKILIILNNFSAPIFIAKTKFNDLKEILQNNKKRLVLFVIYLNRYRNILLKRKTGYSFYAWLDFYTIAILLLAFFKLFIALLFATRPTFIYNIVTLATFFIISFIFNLPEKIRTNIIIPLYNKTLSHVILESPDTYKETETELIQGYDLLTKKEWFFFYFYKAIFAFRLFLLKEPILYNFINFIIIYTLLFNKFYSLSALLSIFITFSKFMFFVADHNIEELKRSLAYISPEFKNGHTLSLTKKNILVVFIWAIRHVYKLSEGEKIKKRKTKADWIDSSSHFLLTDHLEESKFRILCGNTDSYGESLADGSLFKVFGINHGYLDIGETNEILKNIIRIIIIIIPVIIISYYLNSESDMINLGITDLLIKPIIQPIKRNHNYQYSYFLYKDLRKQMFGENLNIDVKESITNRFGRQHQSTGHLFKQNDKTYGLFSYVTSSKYDLTLSGQLLTNLNTTEHLAKKSYPLTISRIIYGIEIPENLANTITSTYQEKPAENEINRILNLSGIIIDVNLTNQLCINNPIFGDYLKYLNKKRVIPTLECMADVLYLIFQHNKRTEILALLETTIKLNYKLMNNTNLSIELKKHYFEDFKIFSNMHKYIKENPNIFDEINYENSLYSLITTTEIEKINENLKNTVAIITNNEINPYQQMVEAGKTPFLPNTNFPGRYYEKNKNKKPRIEYIDPELIEIEKFSENSLKNNFNGNKNREIVTYTGKKTDLFDV